MNGKGSKLDVCVCAVRIERNYFCPTSISIHDSQDKATHFASGFQHQCQLCFKKMRHSSRINCPKKTDTKTDEKQQSITIMIAERKTTKESKTQAHTHIYVRTTNKNDTRKRKGMEKSLKRHTAKEREREKSGKTKYREQPPNSRRRRCSLVSPRIALDIASVLFTWMVRKSDQRM